jgi:FdrA protein
MILNEIRRGCYLDSVALMRLSRQIAGMPGVVEAALMMGTPANQELMRASHLLVEGECSAEGNDLIIGIRAETDRAVRAALDEALHQLDRPRLTTGSVQWRPRSLRAAMNAMAGANLALISVPGDFAAAEARKALRSGLHVMVFSDHVPPGDELALKREARELGRLVMGPDCGTAILNGVPLGFANRVPRGEISLVGASGTGMQEVSCLIAHAGQGVSQAVGVGGRDLSQEIGAISTLMAIDALDADPATKRIVLISKPPHPTVAKRVLERVGQSRKRFTICFIGSEDLALPANARLARTLKEAAELALDGPRIGADFSPKHAAAEAKGSALRGDRIRGLFAGGTLCAEAQIVLSDGGDRRVASNVPVLDSAPLSQATAEMDRIIDLGAGDYTRGRPHPMIDPAARDDALEAALRDPTVAVVLLDVVIGYGAHADPAGHLGNVVARRARSGPVVVASVTGTDQDPQVRSLQIARLRAAGVLVAPSNAQAAELALALCRRPS